MGLPVTIYKSTDAGAPVVNITKPSDWITVLKKCLVDGYGDKQPLGWTLEFENTTVRAAVFRNNSIVGSGGYLQINAVSGADDVSNDIDIHVAKVVTGIGSFIDKLTARRLDIISGQTTGWVVIGTSRGFWMIQPSNQTTAGLINYSAAAACWHVFIGDMECFDPNDSSPFTIVHGLIGTDESTSVLTTSNLGSSNVIVAIMGNANGSSGKNSYNYGTSPMLTSSDINPTLFPIGSPMHLIPIAPILNGSNIATPTEAVPIVRGNVPGLYLSSTIGGRGLTEFYYTLGVDVFRVLQGVYTPHLWLKTSGEWYV